MAKEQLLDEAEFVALMGDALSVTNDEARRDVFLGELARKTWDELEAVEHGDYMLFPEKLWKRRKDGKFHVTPVMVRVPRKDEMRLARALAHRIAKEDGIDPKIDAVQFDDLENVCVMAYAVRSPTFPYEFLFAASKDDPDPRMLERKFDEGSLVQLWSKLATYKEMLNPRPGSVTREEYLALVAAIAERRDIRPLRVIDGSAQSSFIITTACLLHGLMMRLSSSPSFETSTPERSESASSSGS